MQLERTTTWMTTNVPVLFGEGCYALQGGLRKGSTEGSSSFDLQVDLFEFDDDVNFGSCSLEFQNNILNVVGTAVEKHTLEFLAKNGIHWGSLDVEMEYQQDSHHRSLSRFGGGFVLRGHGRCGSVTAKGCYSDNEDADVRRSLEKQQHNGPISGHHWNLPSDNNSLRFMPKYVSHWIGREVSWYIGNATALADGQSTCMGSGVVDENAFDLMYFW